LIGGGGGLLFKGSGFYLTDYRSDGYKKKAKEDSGGSESKGADSKAPAKTDGAAAGDGAKKSAAPPDPASKGKRGKGGKSA
jgi:predicted nucleic acid-binding Zn ribbon protein